MILKYNKSDGTAVALALQDKPVTIGRSPKADIVLEDERASRLHCGIRLIDDEYHIKDLASKNGTYLNDSRIEAEVIKVGDKIRVGGTVITVEKEGSQGTTTALNDVQEAMKGGKGYDTILKEIVKGS